MACPNAAFQVQTLKMQNFEALGRFSSEPALCIQDVQSETLGSTYKFCLPEFEQIEANHTASTQRHVDYYPLAALGSMMCTGGMGRCAERIWAHRLVCRDLHDQVCSYCFGCGPVLLVGTLAADFRL